MSPYIPNEVYTITEYSGFTRGKKDVSEKNYTKLPDVIFDELEKYILTNPADTGSGEIQHFLSLSVRKGGVKVITARNYVGVITIKDKAVIEILPKIAGFNEKDDKAKEIEEVRKIFLGMLKALRDVKFKDFNVSNLSVERLNLFEIFIEMFLEEVFVLTKKGLKAAYTTVEENQRFYKGKLMVPQNIKHNLANLSRFYVSYDDFNINRPENRLIKTTLYYLLKRSKYSENRRKATVLLSIFDEVDYSVNIQADFSKCIGDRFMSHYAKTLSWCRVFLSNKSFTPFAGSETTFAILFPMEKVFESYVASELRKRLSNDIDFKRQDSEYHLFDKPQTLFRLRPDIVLSKGEDRIVLDTKWKLLSDSSSNYGISQADMYQMYAYSKKYKAKKTILLYPRTDKVPDGDINYSSEENEVQVEVHFVDLRKAEDSINSLYTKRVHAFLNQ